MRLSKEKLESFRNELIQRREQLAQELRKSTEKLLEENPNFADSVDQASAETDKTILVQIKNRDRGILGQMDEALLRIEAGTFGSCQECGEPISESRLRANLATTLCIDCKAELESEQMRYSGRVH